MTILLAFLPGSTAANKHNGLHHLSHPGVRVPSLGRGHGGSHVGGGHQDESHSGGEVQAAGCQTQ